jgi:hypothetical protein
VPLVLALLDGDVRALCASACVCTRWRDLLLSGDDTSAELWRVLRVPPHLARRLSDERLLMLVARARGGLRCLDVRGCILLSDDGIAAALAGESSLTQFVASGCSNLSVNGVRTALKGRKLDILHVRGVSACVPNQPFDGDLDASDNDNHERPRVAAELGRLRKLLLKEPDGLDAVAGCTELVPWDDPKQLCGAICAREDRSCDLCDVAYRCMRHSAWQTRYGGLMDIRCAHCAARICSKCHESMTSQGGYDGSCSYCGRQPLCRTCDIKFMPLGASCENDCGRTACDACMRTHLGISMWQTVDPGMRFQCRSCATSPRTSISDSRKWTS